MTERKLVCNFCKKEFKSETYLLKHSCLYCKVCLRKFSHVRHLKTHNCKDNLQPSSQNQSTESLNDKIDNLHPSLPDENLGNSRIIFSGISDSSFPVEEAVKNQTATPCQFNQESHDITVVHVERHSTPFKRVDCDWQLAKCDLPFLQLGLHNPLTDTEFKESAGIPKKTEKMLGDGNCLFRSLSYVITGVENYHMKIRSEVCQFMKNSHFSDSIRRTLMPTFRSVQQYLHFTKMEKDGTWGTEVELFTAALMLNTKIYVYSKVGFEDSWQVHDPKFLDKDTSPSDQSIYISNPRNTHYDVVLDVFPGIPDTVDEIAHVGDIVKDSFANPILFENMQSQEEDKKRESIPKCLENEKSERRAIWRKKKAIWREKMQAAKKEEILLKERKRKTELDEKLDPEQKAEKKLKRNKNEAERRANMEEKEKNEMK